MRLLFSLKHHPQDATERLQGRRLKNDLEEKMLKEHTEWEKYKRENKHNYPQVKLKKLKLDKLGATPGLCRAP